MLKFTVAQGTHLNIQLFDFNKRTDSLPGFIKVNGIYFDSNFDMFQHKLQVEPGTYNIESFFLTKEVHKVNGLKIDKNDSIVLRVYMKDDLTPIE